MLRDALKREPTDAELIAGLAAYAARLEERVSAGFERRPSAPSLPPKKPQEPVS